ncbi:MAG TPA: hypothetical protein EYH53_02555 [Methanothermococcus okinawensis]|nr:hypothetical protein [Methanothermococcus okinawensis]
MLKLSNIRYLLTALILFTFVQGINLVSAEESFNKIVEDSPYPEFIYIDKKLLPKILKNYGVDIPPFLFFFVDGIYINIENPEEKAVRTPIWFLVKIVKFLNLLDENINPEEGFIFINSKYVGKPEYYINMEVSPGDIVIYSKEFVKSIKFEGEDTAYVSIVVKKEGLTDTMRDEYIIRKMIENIDNIKGVKVRESNVQVEGELVFIDMIMDANISDIDKLTSIINVLGDVNKK